MMMAAIGGWSFVTFALFAPSGLAAAAWFGFWLGRRRRPAANETPANVSPTPESPLDQTPERILGAQAIGDRKTISRQVQTGLATLQSNVLEFKERLAARSRQPSSIGERQHLVEAEKLLQPTLDLASQIAQAYDEIRQQTNRLIAISEPRTDALTGLSNRHALDEALRNHFAMFSRYDNKFSLVLLDVDQFERLNHQQGSSHGDRVLQQVGSLLGELVRETDLATRFGGDEFVLVLPETNLFGACVLAERLRGGGRTTVWRDGQRRCRRGARRRRAEDAPLASRLGLVQREIIRPQLRLQTRRPADRGDSGRLVPVAGKIRARLTKTLDEIV